MVMVVILVAEMVCGWRQRRVAYGQMVVGDEGRGRGFVLEGVLYCMAPQQVLPQS
jgi:hypothetical protein